MRALVLPALVLVAVLALDRWQRPRDVPDPVRADFTQELPQRGLAFDMLWVPDAGVWLGRHEVTWSEYEAYYFSKDLDEGAQAIARPSPSYLPHDKGWGAGRRPAVGISRHAAEQYCAWLSRETGRAFRLPTAAEWEAAYDATVPLDEAAWHAGNAEGRTEEVGTKAADPRGFHDLRGNAWEYVGDPVAEGAEGPPMRGGCFDTPAADFATLPRMDCPAERWNDSDPQRPRGIWWLPDGPYVGFRVACAVEPR